MKITNEKAGRGRFGLAYLLVRTVGKIDDAIRKEKGGGSPQEPERILYGAVVIAILCAGISLCKERETWMMQFGKGKPTGSKELR